MHPEYVDIDGHKTTRNRRPFDMDVRDEISALISRPRSSTENRRMFQLYNELSGRSKPLKACNCSGKVKTVKDFLLNYLNGNT